MSDNDVVLSELMDPGKVEESLSAEVSQYYIKDISVRLEDFDNGDSK